MASSPPEPHLSMVQNIALIGLIYQILTAPPPPKREHWWQFWRES